MLCGFIKEWGAELVHRRFPTRPRPEKRGSLKPVRREVALPGGADERTSGSQWLSIASGGQALVSLYAAARSTTKGGLTWSGQTCAASS